MVFFNDCLAFTPGRFYLETLKFQNLIVYKIFNCFNYRSVSVLKSLFRFNQNHVNLSFIFKEFGLVMHFPVYTNKSLIFFAGYFSST